MSLSLGSAPRLRPKSPSLTAEAGGAVASVGIAAASSVALDSFSPDGGRACATKAAAATVATWGGRTQSGGVSAAVGGPRSSRRRNSIRYRTRSQCAQIGRRQFGRRAIASSVEPRPTTTTTTTTTMTTMRDNVREASNVGRRVEMSLSAVSNGATPPLCNCEIRDDAPGNGRSRSIGASSIRPRRDTSVDRPGRQSPGRFQQT